MFGYQNDRCVKIIEAFKQNTEGVKKINDELGNLCLVQHLRDIDSHRGLALKIITFHGFHVVVGDLKIEVYIVLKRAENGDFSKLLDLYQDVAIPFEMIRKWMVDISVTFSVLHMHGIAHRDMKSGNILSSKCND